MRTPIEIDGLHARVDSVLHEFRAYREKNPVVGDYAFDLTLPYLETYAEILRWVEGTAPGTPRLDEQLRSALEQTKETK